MNQFLLYSILILDLVIILTLIYQLLSKKGNKREKYQFPASCEKGEVFDQYGRCFSPKS